jgi:hypothetical protein
MAWTNKAGEVKTYYKCNGRAQFRGIYGAHGQKCPAPPVPGSLEAQVWEDIVHFAMDSESALDELCRENDTDQSRVEALRQEADVLRRQLGDSGAQRERILGLYRRGVIDDTAVEQQMQAIQAEHAQVKASLEDIERRLASLASRDARIEQAGATLLQLVRLLDGVKRPLDFAAKRRLVEELVERIEIESVEHDGRVEQVAKATYILASIAHCTDTDSSRRLT